MKQKTLSTVCQLFYILAVFPTGLGFYHLLAYSNGDYGGKTNAFVGGDAYNYIINAGQATAYFVLALCCVVIATGCLIGQAILAGNKDEK